MSDRECYDCGESTDGEFGVVDGEWQPMCDACLDIRKSKKQARVQ